MKFIEGVGSVDHASYGSDCRPLGHGRNHRLNECRHEREDDDVAAVCGIYEPIADAIGDDHAVRTATLDEPEHGLTDDVLEATAVLLWWGQEAHDEAADRAPTEFESATDAEAAGASAVCLSRCAGRRRVRRTVGGRSRSPRGTNNCTRRTALLRS